MKLNLEWLKKHPAAAGAAIVVGLLVLFLLFRRTGQGGSDLASLAAGQQSGQLQLAQLNAQETAQQEQLQAQLSAQEFATSAQEQQSRDQLAAQVFSNVLPYELELAQLSNTAKEQAALVPLEQQLITYGTSGKAHGSLIGLNENELAVLAGEGIGTLAPVGSPYEPQAGKGFSIGIPGLVSLGYQSGSTFPQTLGAGLFG